jgi:hypothetical protein
MPSNNVRLQAVNSEVCGLYVILYIKLVCRGYTLADMLSCFTAYDDVNDAIVSAIF